MMSLPMELSMQIFDYAIENAAPYEICYSSCYTAKLYAHNKYIPAFITRHTRKAFYLMLWFRGQLRDIFQHPQYLQLVTNDGFEVVEKARE